MTERYPAVEGESFLGQLRNAINTNKKSLRYHGTWQLEFDDETSGVADWLNWHFFTASKLDFVFQFDSERGLTVLVRRKMASRKLSTLVETERLTLLGPAREVVLACKKVIADSPTWTMKDEQHQYNYVIDCFKDVSVKIYRT
ncbi:hypothetical protein NG895_04775 [Aeoliella sp. ICT_H6.2]|uniref:Uncharacterized protein n=1 Tax=Aeoliella straminimaris TaxID=2954799 RepID=A0A9X2JF06_9BACT|nr:hypothetical protein [Aeoliella straminimaris]MCO6043211.1 hypothetical protein [Aeoliella straminimaris]